MALLTPVEPTLTGVNPAAPAAASAGGDTFTAPRGSEWLLRVINGGGSPITATIDDPNSPSPVGATTFNPDLAVVVTNGQERMIKIDENAVARFRAAATGLISIAYSGVTTVTVQLIRTR
jgi:hypothetical protein